MAKANECYFQYSDDCYLNVNVDPAVMSGSGMVTVTVVRHPKGSAETFKSFPCDRGRIFRSEQFFYDDKPPTNEAAPIGESPSVTPHRFELICPAMLRVAYDAWVKSLQG